MTRIVGRLQTIFRSRFYPNGEARVMEMIHELHATKGWRRISKRKARTSDPSVPVYHQAFVRRPSKKTYVEPPPIPETALLRHGWYRRQQRKINDQRIAEAST